MSKPTRDGFPNCKVGLSTEYINQKRQNRGEERALVPSQIMDLRVTRQKSARFRKAFRAPRLGSLISFRVRLVYKGHQLAGFVIREYRRFAERVKKGSVPHEQRKNEPLEHHFTPIFRSGSNRN